MTNSTYTPQIIDEIHQVIEFNHRRLWFGITDPAITRQTTDHGHKTTNSDRQRTPWILKSSRGRILGRDAQLKLIYHMIRTNAGLVIFPHHYQTIVIDVDEGRMPPLRQDFPPLHSSFSRSHYGYKGPASTQRGHLWYRQPRTPRYLKDIPARDWFQWKGHRYKVDFLFTSRDVFVPPQEVLGVLQFLATGFDDTAAPFPTEFLALHRHKGDRRNDGLQMCIEDQRDQGGAESLDEDRWRQVSIEIGYEADHPGKFDEMFARLRDKPSDGPTSASPADPHAQPYDHRGLTEILDQLGWQARYNVRQGQAELQIDGHWLSMRSDDPARYVRHTIRKLYTVARSKIGKPWDPAERWPKVLDWIESYAWEHERYNPVQEHLDRWAAAEPMDPDDSLLLRVIAPATDADGLRARIIRMERALLRTLWLRLQPGGAEAQIHFPFMPVLIGPPGSGKSRYCHALSLGYLNHTSRFDDPPKVFGEAAQASVVIEMRELKEQLGKPGAQVRGQAKAYIEQNKYTFRAAYQEGSKAHDYFLGGVLIGTSNYVIATAPLDGLYRRLIQVPVKRHPDMTKRFDKWDVIMEEWLPRAMSRASRESEMPWVDEDKLVAWMHDYIHQELQLDNKGQWVPPHADFDGAEEVQF